MYLLYCKWFSEEHEGQNHSHSFAASGYCNTKMKIVKMVGSKMATQSLIAFSGDVFHKECYSFVIVSLMPSRSKREDLFPTPNYVMLRPL